MTHPVHTITDVPDRIELGVQNFRGSWRRERSAPSYSTKAKYTLGAKRRPRSPLDTLLIFCRSTYLLDTLLTKFWKNHIKLLYKFLGRMWKQQQQATTTCEIHFSSCFFSTCYFAPYRGRTLNRVILVG